MRTLTDHEAVKVGLWLDDPYGDGIRLERIREPSPKRRAALDYSITGQRTLEDLEADHIFRGHAYAKQKAQFRNLIRQGVIKETV